MAYRTIKSPEISGNITVKEVMAISLAISHRQKKTNILLNVKSKGGLLKIARRKSWVDSKEQKSTGKTIRRRRRRSFRDLE